MAYLRLGLVLLAAACILCGCGGKSPTRMTSEKELKHFKQGQYYYRNGNYELAMASFQRVLDERPDAPESNLELGRIYMNHLSDPISAIYHFRKFLEMKPNAEQSPFVKQLIETAKKRFARTLPGRSSQDEHSRVDLLHLVKQLKDENNRLRRQIAQGGGTPQVDKEELPSFAPVRRPAIANNQPKFYTVGNGDSLSGISLKVYGSSAYWEKIFKANGDTLKTPHSLKVGQVLRIPSR